MDGQPKQSLQKDELRLPSLSAPVGYRNGGRNEGNLPFLGGGRASLCTSVWSGLMVKEGGCLC